MTSADAAVADDVVPRVHESALERLPPLAAALVVCAALGALSTLVPAALGYDSWAWMVWGRELMHVDLHTDGGPSWKPLPVLLVAPFALVGDVAPHVWLALVRGAAFAAFLFAFRIAERVADMRTAGIVAVAALAVCADFFVTALRGYSEPLLIALALAAIDQHQQRRYGPALVLSALAGLLRPEAWVFTFAYGGYLLLRHGHVGRVPSKPTIAALTVVAPVLWLGLDWLGSGDALESSRIAQTAPPGSASKTAHPALTVVERAADAVILPVLVLAIVAVAVAVRRRDRAVLWLGGLVAAWVGIVAIMAEAGFAGRRRYLIVAGAVACVLAGVGVARLLAPIQARARRLLLASTAVVFAGFGFVALRADWRWLGLGGQQERQLSELRSAAALAGGGERLAARGRVVVNPYVQTALAWELGLRLAAVRGPSGSTRTRPGWRPPATVFRAPARLAGHRPAMPTGVVVTPIARSGRWQVLAVDRRRAGSTRGRGYTAVTRR